jgi:gas vesicle protein
VQLGVNICIWANSSSKAFGISFADRPKAKRQKRWSKNCQKVVKKLSKTCRKAVKKLSKSCQKNVKKLSKKNLVQNLSKMFV